MSGHTCALWISILLIGTAYPQDRITGALHATRSAVLAVNGMAATSQPLATQVALDILKRGGTAVDAAIAANAALGLMEPTGCGIGGDLFALVWDGQTRKLYGLNASGRSPRSLTLDEFRKRGLNSIPPYGPLPVTVPGCVDGWFELHERFGKLSLETILQPAIQYARDGFPVSELIAHYWNLSIPARTPYPNYLEIFTIDGRAPRPGEIFRNPWLARTYEKLARGGREAFYRGDIARTIVRYLQANGGFLSLEDLAGHTSTWVDPVSTSYRGYEVWELPPNGQGLAVLQMLNILEGFDLQSYGFGSPEHIHLFVETKKLVYEDRAKYYADPEFAHIPVRELISKDYAAARRKLINPERAARNVTAGDPRLEQGETIYLTVADRWGTMVSLIQSNYRGMGSGMTPDGLGFILQDRGELFSLEEGHNNCYAPGKRPFHTIIPGFVTRDGQPFMSFGVMGGAFQPLGHVQILTNLLDFGMGVQEAGDAPRIYHTGSSQPTGESAAAGGGMIHLESGFPYETIRTLLEKGHTVGYALGPYGGYQAILFDTEQKVYHGASESRKDGQAAGY